MRYFTQRKSNKHTPQTSSLPQLTHKDQQEKYSKHTEQHATQNQPLQWSFANLAITPSETTPENIPTTNHSAEPQIHFSPDNPLQRKTNHQTEQTSITTKKPEENRTGLPNTLKTNIEQLSGYSLDDIHIHYNSSYPAEVSALAYTQGPDIYIGPGQEQHLAHEAWHVVQQKRGNIPPTTQIGHVAINDDKHLEREADARGQQATRDHIAGPATNLSKRSGDTTVAQLMIRHGPEKKRKDVSSDEEDEKSRAKINKQEQSQQNERSDIDDDKTNYVSKDKMDEYENKPSDEQEIKSDEGEYETVDIDIEQIRKGEFKPEIKSEALDFITQTYRKQNHMPSTGLGAFDAEYIPMKDAYLTQDSNLIIVGELNITVKVDMKFIAGDRQKWESEQEQKKWFSDYVTTIENIWSDRYVMYSQKENWPGLDVKTKINVVQVENGSKPHFQFEVKKQDNNASDAYVHHPPGHEQTPNRQYSNDREPFRYPDFTEPNPKSSLLFSSDINEREENTQAALSGEKEVMNRMAPLIKFGEYQKTYEFLDNDAAQNAIKEFGALVSNMGKFKLRIEFQNLTSPRNYGKQQDIATQRVAKILPTWEETGVSFEHSINANEKNREHKEEVQFFIKAVDILNNDDLSNTAMPAAHEFGHMIGLGEEYYTKQMASQAPDYSHHYNLVATAYGEKTAELFTRPAEGLETTSIMSHGSSVRPYHYVTLWEVLSELSSKHFKPKEWIIERK